MRNISTVWFLIIAISAGAQQKQTFDLATYSAPPGWKESMRTKDVVGYTVTNNRTGTFCQVGIYASTLSKGNADADFESEWQNLVVKQYSPSEAPDMVDHPSFDGWQVRAGVAPFPFNGGQSMAILVTFSGYEKCLSIVAVTNTDAYKADFDSFLTSVNLKTPEIKSLPVTNNTDTNKTTTNESDGSIVGTWRRNTSDNSSYRMNNGLVNYIMRQYIFDADGTYKFTSKAFDPLMGNLIFGKEHGSYKIDGNHLTVIPQKSVLQSWSKKDGTDKFGKLLNSQDVALETTRYTFTKHYFSGIQEYNLVLQVDAETARDGAMSTNTTFPNAYYYSPLSSIRPLIEEPDQETSQVSDVAVKSSSGSAAKGPFAFTTTNFDDGWTSTERQDWVEVSRGSVTVLIHYPDKRVDGYNTDAVAALKNAWDVLVAPRYTTGSNLNFQVSRGWQTCEFGEGDLKDRAGKTVHVALFKKHYSGGTGRYLEIITPDKRSFEQEFGSFDISSSDWEKVEKMAGYNKFAVAAKDLQGTWKSDFTGMQQYVNAYTGANAGMSTYSSNESFVFTGENSYSWKVGVASGFVGNLKFQGAKADGTFTLPTPWQIRFSDIEGKPRTYDAYFSCIKGARLLWLGETGYGRAE